MDLAGDIRRSARMRLAALVLCIAALAAPAAFAKGRLVVRVGDSTPGVGQPFTVYVHTGFVVPQDDWLRLIPVPPGAILGNQLARDGIRMTRTSRTTWRAVVRLDRAGRWRLVVPNGTHVGYMAPPPAEWMPWVRVHR
jgi:hypothetical protein